MSDPKLEKCPWCNGAELEYRRSKHNGKAWWCVQCDECQARSPSYPTREALAVAWNELSNSSTAMDHFTEQTIKLERLIEKWGGVAPLQRKSARNELLEVLGQQEGAE